MSQELTLQELAMVAGMNHRELHSSMKDIAAKERVLSVSALIRLGEIDERKLYAREAYPTMFDYCIGELGYSEGTAWRRIQAARKARLFPEILSLIRDGCLTVCALSLLAKHLTSENRTIVLKQAEGKRIREIEKIAAALRPLADTSDVMRSLPAPSASRAELTLEGGLPQARSDGVQNSAEAEASPQMAPAPQPGRQKIIPRAPERVLFSFTGSEELRRVIDRLRELLWHKHPDGRLEDILLEAGRLFLTLKDPELRPKAKPKPPRADQTRAVPRRVRSLVYRRDGGRCVFKSADGRRCEARRSLEYDHVRPWALGGRSDDPKNIRLLCRAHNQWAARTLFPAAEQEVKMAGLI